mmetsp:Transcript_39803/g.125284  ORF Transcript_39803/g.125284 Transcript_39803/m.125284 type:complete len:1011 (+) Transcript_39803:111-3143(+)
MSGMSGYGAYSSGAGNTGSGGRQMEDSLSSLYRRSVQGSGSRSWASDRGSLDGMRGGSLQPQDQRAQQPQQFPQTGQRQQMQPCPHQFQQQQNFAPQKQDPLRSSRSASAQNLLQPNEQQVIIDSARAPVQQPLFERLLKKQQMPQQPELQPDVQLGLQAQQHGRQPPQAQQQQQQQQQQQPWPSASAKLDRLVKQGAEKNRMRKIATPQAADRTARLPTSGLKGGVDTTPAAPGTARRAAPEPKPMKGPEPGLGRAAGLRGNAAGPDSDDDSAEAMQCDPMPKSLSGAATPAQGSAHIDSLAALLPPSKGAVAGAKHRGPTPPDPADEAPLVQPAEPADDKLSERGGDSSMESRQPEGRSQDGESMLKRQRTAGRPETYPSAGVQPMAVDTPAAGTPQLAASSAPDDVAMPSRSSTQDDEATATPASEVPGEPSAYVCEVLEPRPVPPLQLQLLGPISAQGRRARSPSAGSQASQEAPSQHLRPSSPAPPTPSWVEAVAAGDSAAALRGLAAELRAMEEVEEAQALLHQLPDAGLVAEGSAGMAEDHCQNLAGICRERLPRWLMDLERLERRLTRDCQETQEAEKQGRPEEVLRMGRQAGAAFSRAIQQVMDGTPSGAATREGALTLEEELVEFAKDAAEGRCGLSTSKAGRQSGVSAGEAGEAAADLWEGFGDVHGYAEYLEKVVRVAGADVPLSGGAAWHRLMAELEVATRLCHLHPEHLQGLDGLALQLQGAHVLGGQGWEDMAQKLMHCMALGPLQRRARYAVARVAWTLRRQKVAAGAWLRTVGKGPVGWLYASVPQHWQLLESHPQVRDIVFGAVDTAAAAAAAPLLAFFEAAICSGCQSPQLLLRPRTRSELQLCKVGRASPADQSEETEKSQESIHGSAARSRVLAEVRQRCAASPLLPASGPSIPHEAGDRLQVLLGCSFGMLRSALVGHVLSFAGTALASFTNRGLDEAIGSLGLQPRERRTLESGHRRLQAAAARAKDRLEAAQRCTRALRHARTLGF